MFDKLIIMVKGEIVYQGGYDFALDFFKQVGFECPELSNPADHFIKTL